MFRILYIAANCILIYGLAWAMFVPLDGASARSSETVLHSFTGGNDGAYPAARLLADSAGNLYGTTKNGGSATDCEEGGGCGTVFRLAPDGTETVLYSFCNQTNCADGANPLAGLIADAQGNFYGTTYDGGGGTDCQQYSSTCGTVFKLAPDGTETVLYSFKGGNDGSEPVADLIMDKKGNLYGTTLGGGAQGVGTIFELASDGTETVLHAFTGAPDGANPAGGVIADGAGNLYGTTAEGGAGTLFCSLGCGTVFKLAPDGTETVLYSFCSQAKCVDGIEPSAGLINDKAGNLYGTTISGGGKVNCENHKQLGCGTIFRLAPDGIETVLYSFKGDRNGLYPGAALIADKKGNLYGTTLMGGKRGSCYPSSGCGTVFKLAPDGTETNLHAFAGSSSDGSSPDAGLIADASGNLYGTTYEGGANGVGTIFKLKK